MKTIGQVAREYSVSAVTLRYYERLGLLGPIQRTPGGQRLYTTADCSTIGFIRKSQKMGFSLAEIQELLQFRKNPQQAKPEIRQLAQHKLHDIEEQLRSMELLRNELQLLLNLCCQSKDSCPIMENLENR